MNINIYIYNVSYLCTLKKFTDYETKLSCLTDALLMACFGEQSFVCTTFHMCLVKV